MLSVSLDELVGRSDPTSDEVRDARLRSSVRELEGLGDVHLIDVVITVIDGSVQSRANGRFKR